MKYQMIWKLPEELKNSNILSEICDMKKLSKDSLKEWTII